VNRITVRRLLNMFSAERRGFNKVNDIRAALANLGLETTPDFESAWIDERIKIRQIRLDAQITKQGAESAEVIEDVEEDDTDDESQSSEDEYEIGLQPAQPHIVATSEGVVETVLGEAVDPTFRIGRFPAANKKLITVNQDDDLKRAITVMMQFDYSQLPIMHGEREIKGMISWQSIAARLAMGNECQKVLHCREDAQVIDSNGTLFDAIPTIIKYDYVLVRNQQDRRVTGLVTNSDLILQFQHLTEPFLLLREIELHIRKILNGKVDLDINELNFGGYVRLLAAPEVWPKLLLKIDQKELTSELERVRQIRNDVMHFDPDPMEKGQLETLKNAANFMRQLYELRPRI
jgi:predicted transcriptional regulator